MKSFTEIDYKPFEMEFQRAILSTWEAVAVDAVDSDDLFESELDVIVEITLDANRVEMYGQLKGRALDVWKQLYASVEGNQILDRIARQALKDYA